MQTARTLRAALPSGTLHLAPSHTANYGRLRSFPDSMPQIRGVSAMREFPTELILASCIFWILSAPERLLRPSAFVVRYLELLSEQFGRRHRTVANRVQFSARDR